MHMNEEKNTEQNQEEIKEATETLKAETASESEKKTDIPEKTASQDHPDETKPDPAEKKESSAETAKKPSDTSESGTVPPQPPVNAPERKPKKSHRHIGKVILKYVLIFLVAGCGTFAGTYTAIRLSRRQEQQEMMNQFRNFSQIPFGNENGSSENQSSGPALGITIQQTDDGIEIVGFAKNSNAESAGLKEGDIITEVDGKSYDSVTDISDYISSKKVGDKVKVTVKRNNEEKTYSVKLVKKDLSAYSLPSQPQENNGGSDSDSTQPKALPGTDGENSDLQG